jgi:O-antigen ligase
MKSEQRSAETDREDAVTAPFDRAATVEIEPTSSAAERVRREGPRRPREGADGPRRERHPRTLGRSQLPFLAGAVTAAAYVLLSLSDGGFAPGVWAEATVLVWWSALVAVLAGAWPHSRLPAAASLAGLALLGLALLSGVSMEWASDLGAAYEDAIRALGYAGVFALFAIGCRAGAGEQLLAGTAAGIFVVAGLALVSRLEPGFTGGVDESLALDVSGGRLSYPLGYWNALGATMASGLMLLVWLGAGARARLTRSLAVAAIPVLVLTLFFSGSRGGVLATAAGLAVLVVAGPRRVTLASVAALGLGAAIPIVLFAGASPRLVNGLSDAAAAQQGDQLLFLTIATMLVVGIVAYKGDRRLAGMHLPVLGTRRVLTACVIIGVLGTLAADPVNRLRALDATAGETQLSAKEQRTRFATVGGSGRVQFWQAAIDATEAAPLIGIGAGGFEDWWNVDRDLDLPVTHAHSLFFENAAELGLGGAALALLFFAAPVVSGARRRAAPTAWADPDAARGAIGAALAVLGAGLLTSAVEWTWDVPTTFVPVVLAAAFLTVAPARERTASGERATTAPSRGRRLAGVGAFAVLALGATAAAGVLFLSEGALGDARSELAADRPDGALASAQDASDWTPWSARPYEVIAAAERRQGNLGAAADAIEEAEERADRDWTLWFTEAGLDYERERIGPATWNLAYAESLNPLAPAKLFTQPTAIEAGYYREFAQRFGLGGLTDAEPAP